MPFTLTYANIGPWHPAGQSSHLGSSICLVDVVSIIDPKKLWLEGSGECGEPRLWFLFWGLFWAGWYFSLIGNKFSF